MGIDTDCSFLDLQHHSFKIMLDGKLNLAPISKPQRVLDLATGTGIWAIEFGMSILFPNQHFLTLPSPGAPKSSSPRHRSKSNPTRLVKHILPH
jgi:hypothetical protein